MTDSIKMIDELSYWAADQVAECCGVDDQTYGELWNKCVPLYDDLPSGEVPGEIVYALADYGWGFLTSKIIRRETPKLQNEKRRDLYIHLIHSPLVCKS